MNEHVTQHLPCARRCSTCSACVNLQLPPLTWLPKLGSTTVELISFIIFPPSSFFCLQLSNSLRPALTVLVQVLISSDSTPVTL